MKTSVLAAILCILSINADWVAAVIPCKTCKAGDIPGSPGETGWDSTPYGWPVGVGVRFINTSMKNGQCKPPENCREEGCAFWGTLQITNNGPANLTNAEIRVNGVLVGTSGQLNIGATRQHILTDPISVSCEATGEIVFSVTSGQTVYENKLKLTCHKCE